MINEKCATKYCREDLSLIENYELAITDTTQTWEIHHRRGTIYSSKDLKEIGEYYNRPAAELIFLTPTTHKRLHLKGIPMSDANKKALIEAHRGVPRSEATKKAISEALRGVPKGPMSDAHKKAIGKAHKGIPRSEAVKKAIGEANSKKILQLTKSGEFIKEWPSAMEASRQLGIAQQSICSCCKGKRNYAGGYVWKYA